MRIQIIILQIYFIITASLAVCAAKEESQITFDAQFFQNFQKIPAISRDDFFEEKLNRIIICRGIVTAIAPSKLHKKKFRISLKANEADKYGLIITYHVHAEKKDSAAILSNGMGFEFSGQLIAYTPIDIKRNEYIFDVMLEKGAIVIE
jgi:hypothetical protein